MKKFTIEKQGNTYLFKDDNILIYTGIYQNKGATTMISLQNAFHEEILNISNTQSGFKLFRGNKPKNYRIQMDEKQGVISAKEQTYEWSYAGILYTFSYYEENHEVRIIMQSAKDVLGYVKQDELYLLNGLYSAVLCMFYISLLESKERVYCERTSFQKQWEELPQA